MLRGNRLIIVALGLILAGASPPPNEDRQKPSDSAPAKVERSLEDMAATLREANKPSDLEQPCEEGDNKRSSDLCAQWKAADAARDAANAAWLLGALGTLIGAFTLAAAWSAARWARKAAVETEKGARAAISAVRETKAANNIARETAHLELRAYVSIDDTNGEIHGDDWHPRVKFTNCGNTPAKQVWAYANWIATASLHEEFDFPPGEFHADDGHSVIGPGRSITAICHQPIPVGMIEAVLMGGINIYIWAAVDYIDIYGDIRRTEYAAKCLPTRTGGDAINIEFTTLNRHNGMDKDCLKPLAPHTANNGKRHRKK